MKTRLQNILLLVFVCMLYTIHTSAQSPIYVRGTLIQIYRASANGWLYPNGERSGSDDFFPNSIPAEINGKEFATSVPEDGVGPKQVSGEAGRYVIAAVHHKDITIAGWTDMNVTFTMRDDATPRNTYYLFRLDITEPGTWYDIPQQHIGANAPTLLFADQGDVKWVDFTPLDGEFIVQKAASATLIADPAICILPNGNLMALAWGPSPKRQFLSTDGGLTWTGYGPDYLTIRFATPFSHNGALYMLSSFRPGDDPGIFIRKSLDNGQTWETYDGKDHVVLTSDIGNGALNCPSPVVIAQGRIWRAIGDKGPDDRPNLGFMSAPVDADLMDPASWSYTNFIDRGSSDGRVGGILKPWEPCAVATPNGGYPVLLARTGPSDGRNGDASPVYRATSATTATFAESDVIDFLGAKDKFCVQYDPVSERYWALANTAAAAEYGGSEYIWSRRSRLVLQSSSDLLEWHVEKILAQASDARFSGYQYPFFVFDGDDIVAAIRTAAEYEDGMAKRAHDANFLTFLRVENFREYHTKTKAVTLRKGWDMIFADAKNTQQGDSPKLYTEPDDTSNEWEQISLDNGSYIFRKLGTNLAMQAGTPGNPITLEAYNENNVNQQWKKVKADFRHFALESNAYQGYVIDGGNSNNGQVLTLAARNTNNENQNWEIEPTRTELNELECSLIPYLNINDAGWNRLSDTAVIVGDKVWFGPQSETYGPNGGTWSWEGPDGFTYTGRSLVLNDIQESQMGIYTVTDIDQSGCSAEYTFDIRLVPSQTSIVVQGNGFEKRTFTNGTEIFTNRDYVIQNAPVDFIGFEFLASGGKEANEGIIIPQQDGYVYIVAPPGTIDGWEQIEGLGFHYDDVNETTLAIFRKEATANKAIEIPIITAFPGASPLGASITIVPIETQAINLQQGWNLVSTYVHPKDSAIATLFPNASIVKTQETFYRSTQPNFLNTLTSIEGGVGYLVYNNIGETIDIRGATLSRTPNMTLNTGWNLIGCPFSSSTSIEFAFGTELENIQIIKDFDGFWESDNQLSNLNEFTPGKAYFIKK